MRALASLVRSVPRPLAWTAAVLEMWGIFALSRRTWSGVEPGFPGAGNLFHIVLYGVLGCCLALGLGVAREGRGQRWAVGLTALYGFSDEVHQFFVPGRACSLFDGIVDGLAAAVAVWALAACVTPDAARRTVLVRRAGFALAAAVGLALAAGRWLPQVDALLARGIERMTA
jgi:hypothetical protein